MDKKDVLLEIKPKYSAFYMILSNFLDILVFLAILIWIGSKPEMSSKVTIIGIIISLVVCVYIYFRKNRNKLCFYRFYEDKIVYRNTYFSKRIQEIKYDTIKNIRYNQSFLQSRFKIGQIAITTNEKNVLKKIVFFELIPNVEENCKKIAEIVKL